MSKENEKTVKAYEKYAAKYIKQNADDASAAIVESKHKMLDDCLQGVPKDGKLFEVGSASGEDAAYIKSLGYNNLTVSDVADSFIAVLEEKGFSPIKFNILSDDFPEQYDFIYCWAVLMHFAKDEAKEALKKIYNALTDGGKVLLCVKSSKDKTEEWKELGEEDGKIYFSFWLQDELELFLKTIGFSKVKIWGYGDWIDCLAEK